MGTHSHAILAMSYKKLLLPLALLIIGIVGCCKGGSVYWCESGNLYNQGCASEGQFCGWYAGDMSASEGYYCQDTAMGADPSGSWPIDCPALTALRNSDSRSISSSE